jgi:uncharacterized membrane protein YccC
MTKRLFLSDPGLMNFQGALRGTLTAVFSFFAVSIFARHFHQPPTLAFIGVLISMMGSIVVNDPTRVQRMVTMALLPIPASLAFALSIGLSPWPQARLIAFLSMTFLAVSLRRFGSRGSAFGIIVFMAYLSPQLFPLHADAIPAVAASICISTIVAFGIRLWIVPERTHLQLRIHLKSFSVLYEANLETIEQALANSNRSLLKKAESLFQKLNELSLALEQFLSDNSIKSSSEHLRLQIFERELALRHLLNECESFLNQPTGLSISEPSVDQALAEARKFRDVDFSESCQENEIVDEIKKSKEKAKARPAPSPSARSGVLHISTRQAIQATLATALATLLGTSVSPARWYWASIAAFMVFVGASRGETMIRASLRTIGTIAGLIIGFAVAYFLSGHHGLEWAVIIACVYFAIYGSRIAFGFWTSALFTLMLAVLYDLLGQLTPEILMLRLEETLVGSVIGAVIGAYVLPNSTRTGVRVALSKLLRTAALALDELPTSAQPFMRRATIRRLRDVDRDLMDLRIAVAPIISRGSTMRNEEMIGIVHDVTVLVHFLRHLVIDTDPARYIKHANHLSKDMQLLANAIDSINVKSSNRERSLKGEPPGGDSVSWLIRVEAALKSLAERCAMVFSEKQ